MDKYEVIFYEEETGEVPVEDFLCGLDKRLRAKFAGFIKKTSRSEITKAIEYRKDYIERSVKNEKI